MTIYVDIVLLENLCMNTIILFSTAYIMKLKIKFVRIIISSLLGSIYAILVYADVFPMYSNIIFKIILSICMVYIAFKPKKISGLIKELILFYLVSFALGGCAFALLYIIRPQDIFMNNGVYIGTYPIKIALLGGVTGFIVTYIAFKVVKTKITKNEIIYEVVIKIEDKELKTNVILDTGNMLKDPITNDSVILVEKDVLCNILPATLLDSMNVTLGGDLGLEEADQKYKTRARIIPFSSVGKSNGMFIGIKIDELKIITDVDEIINKNVIVCSYEKKFSKTGKYHGLISLDVLDVRKDVIKNEHFANVEK